MRKRTVATACAASATALLAFTAGARADGLPVFGTSGGQGVLSLDGGTRFVTIADHAAAGTFVERIDAHGGEVEKTVHLDGAWTLSPVAVDGSATGVSADGSTIALVRPGFGQRDAHIALLGAARLELIDRVHLNGTFSLDAISPDGDGLFLIHYANRYGSTDYKVQRYDVSNGRLGPPIVDPREPDEKMVGYPYSRTTSPDGRWAYTLYDGPKEQFIHALDTQRGRAFCVDLDGVVPRKDLWRSTLDVSPDGGTLSVIAGGTTMASIDTKSFDVARPSGSDEGSPETSAPADDDPTWWLLAAGAAAVVLALGLALGGVRARRRRPPEPDPDWASLAGPDGGEPGAGEDGHVATGSDSANGALQSETGAVGSRE
jgi:hypothetical protein